VSARGVAEVGSVVEAAARLDDGLAAVLRGAWAASECGDLASRVGAARSAWTEDFGGEQFSLGRAFYTHLETGRAAEYFASVAEADARVESLLPGVQARVRALYAAMVGGRARQRVGFCGPGVHVFPAHGKVAREGGVAHWDVEGMAPEHLARRRRAVSLVLMLQPPTRGGALTLWDATWDGADTPSAAALAAASAPLRYAAGDVAVFSSYRLHRIRPFAGDLDRVSLTVHGVEVDRGVWELWF
jgi:hypothetical protein